MKRQTKKKEEAPRADQPGLLDEGFMTADELGLTGTSIFIARPAGKASPETAEESSNPSPEEPGAE